MRLLATVDYKRWKARKTALNGRSGGALYLQDVDGRLSAHDTPSRRRDSARALSAEIAVTNISQLHLSFLMHTASMPAITGSHRPTVALAAHYSAVFHSSPRYRYRVRGQRRLSAGRRLLALLALLALCAIPLAHGSGF
jgi:hypothetical protein